MYSYKYLEDFTTKLFQKAGCSKEHAEIVSKTLVSAELRGIPSHGLIRIIDYLGMYEKGRINTKPNIKIEHETPTTAVVNGDSSFGMIAGEKSMEIAIEKAEKYGTGWVSTKNSNHFGIAGHFTMMAAKKDMIGIAMTNANPLVAPTLSKSKLLGTNPISVAIPAGKYEDFIADFATTPIARGKLAVKGRLNQDVPEGFVQDKEGNPSTNPDIIKEGGAILPLGGDYEHGSHKGYCLGAIVDIFSSVLSGANFGPFVPPQVPYLPLKDEKVGEGLGHFFGAMRIDAFQTKDEFKKQMDKWIETFKSAEPANDEERVMIPGEPEFISEKEKTENGINLLDSVVDDLIKTGKKYDVEFKRK